MDHEGNSVNLRRFVVLLWQYRTELVVQYAYGQASLTRQIFRQIV